MMLWAKFVEIDPVVQENNMKIWKVYDNTNDDNDKFLSEKLTWDTVNLL